MPRYSIPNYIQCLPKNVTTSSCCNAYTHESIVIIFCANVSEKVGSQKLHHFPTSPNYASALPDEMKKDKNSILPLKCCTVVLTDFNQTLA